MAAKKLTIEKKGDAFVLKVGAKSPKGFKCKSEEEAKRLAIQLGLLDPPKPKDPPKGDDGGDGDDGKKQGSQGAAK